MQDMEQLVKRTALGDKKAFEELYKRTYKQVYFTCNAFLKNEQDAADAMQDVYLIALHSIDTLKDASKFESWLGRITINKCKDYLKKNKPVFMEDEVLEEMLVEDDELILPEEYAMNKAKRKILMDIMKDNLSDTLYQTVVLFYFHEMSTVEIAEWMECPVGTVTSRLCIARTKIKDAVLAYEKKSGDKLHGLALIPILALLFKEEASAMEPDYLYDKMMNTSSTEKITTSIAKAGGREMLQSLKGKLLAGIIALLVVCGGIAVIISQRLEKNANTSDSDKVVEESTDYQEKTEQTDNFETNELSPSISEDNQETISDDCEQEEIIYDYDVMAQSIATQIEEFFLALTSGDVETLLEMSVVNEEGYEQLEKISKYDCTPEFLRIMFGDVKYCINEETISDIAYDLEFAHNMEKTYMHVDIAYSKPLFMVMANMYPSAFADGTAIAERPNLVNLDKAFAVYEQALSVVPMVNAPDFFIQLPDENGKIKVVIDYVFDGLDLDDVKKWDDIWPAHLLDRTLKMSDDIIVGDNGKPFEENHAMVVEIDKYLSAKDFKGLEAYLSSLTGEDYATEYGEKFGTYEELTDTQKQFVDQFIAEKFDYQLVDYIVNNERSAHHNYRNGMLILTYPVLDDTLKHDIMLTDWYDENKVMEYTFAFPSTFKADMYMQFVCKYYYVIEYASKYVE